MPKKPRVDAVGCYEKLRTLAEQYKELEQQFREAGNNSLADEEHENYRTMVAAMAVLVRTHGI